MSQIDRRERYLAFSVSQKMMTEGGIKKWQ